MSKNKKLKLQKQNKGITREKMKADGFFDGRFVERKEILKNKYFRKIKHKNKKFED